MQPPPGTSNQAVRVPADTGVAIARRSRWRRAVRPRQQQQREEAHQRPHARRTTSAICRSARSGCPPNAPLTTYAMRTHTTKAWVNAEHLVLCGHAWAAPAPASTSSTTCWCSTTPTGSTTDDRLRGRDGADAARRRGRSRAARQRRLRLAARRARWSTFGNINGAVTSGVFEFIQADGRDDPRASCCSRPAQTMTANQILTAHVPARQQQRRAQTRHGDPARQQLQGPVGVHVLAGAGPAALDLHVSHLRDAGMGQRDALGLSGDGGCRSMDAPRQRQPAQDPQPGDIGHGLLRGCDTCGIRTPDNPLSPAVRSRRALARRVLSDDPLVRVGS